MIDKNEVVIPHNYKFQEKCKVRMQEMLSGGTTLLFVSHSLKDVLELCDHAVYIKKGEVQMVGNVVDVCRQYNPERTGEVLKELEKIRKKVAD